MDDAISWSHKATRSRAQNEGNMKRNRGERDLKLLPVSVCMYGVAGLHFQWHPLVAALHANILFSDCHRLLRALISPVHL